MMEIKYQSCKCSPLGLEHSQDTYTKITCLIRWLKNHPCKAHVSTYEQITNLS
uniref:Uncharacterized protein n=1 Tax=Rhizophora mucronata TaxID=61149 RepID=A0A2P2PY84_RHIMU